MEDIPTPHSELQAVEMLLGIIAPWRLFVSSVTSRSNAPGQDGHHNPVMASEGHLCAQSSFLIQARHADAGLNPPQGMT